MAFAEDSGRIELLSYDRHSSRSGSNFFSHTTTVFSEPGGSKPKMSLIN